MPGRRESTRIERWIRHERRFRPHINRAFARPPRFISCRDVDRVDWSPMTYDRLAMAQLLTSEALKDALGALPGWDGDTDGIRRTVTAPDFPTGIKIVDAVAEVAEEIDHHPDINIRWRKVTFALRTHSAGGVTEKDIDLAARIDVIVAGYGGT
jgi:4a-hydroxytetrahydrobiopterin dehydratase